MTEGRASPERNVSSLERLAPYVLDAIGHAVILTAPDREILLWNPGSEQLYGWTAEEAVGRDVRGLLASDDAEVNASISEMVAAGKTWSGDYVTHTKDGAAVLVHATAAPVFDESGRMVAIASVAHDVSERRSSEQSLRREAEHLRVAFETARMGSWTWDLTTDVVVWDEAMEQRYGLEPGTFSGTFEEFVSRVHPDDREGTLEAVEHAHANEAELMYEHRVLWPDGSVHWLEARGRPVRDDDGAFVGMVGVGIDIDERKQLQALTMEASELRGTAQLARDLLEAERIAGLGSWRWEADTNVVILSAEMARMLGSERTMTGVEFANTLQRVAHPDDVAELERSAQEALERRQRRYLMECRLMIDGAARTVVHRGEILLDPETRDLIAVRGTFQDITEQRMAETQLQDARLRLVAERRAVQVLHETLIRPSFPALESFDIAARYLAATNDSEIGGDWYDCFSTPGGDVILAVGDVSGHGVTSARLMAKLRHATPRVCIHRRRPLAPAPAPRRFPRPGPGRHPDRDRAPGAARSRERRPRAGLGRAPAPRARRRRARGARRPRARAATRCAVDPGRVPIGGGDAASRWRARPVHRRPRRTAHRLVGRRFRALAPRPRAR